MENTALDPDTLPWNTDFDGVILTDTPLKLKPGNVFDAGGRTLIAVSESYKSPMFDKYVLRYKKAPVE